MADVSAETVHGWETARNELIKRLPNAVTDPWRHCELTKQIAGFDTALAGRRMQKQLEQMRRA